MWGDRIKKRTTSRENEFPLLRREREREIALTRCFSFFFPIFWPLMMSSGHRLRHMRSQPSMLSPPTASHAVVQPISEQSSTRPPPSRTQHKLLLQRQSFLADDKDYLDHPQNMKRLTKELDRVNREYRSVRQFEDPMAQSFRRVIMNAAAESSSSSSPSCLHHHHHHLRPPGLQRRSSAHTFVPVKSNERGVLNRLFPGSPPQTK